MTTVHVFHIKLNFHHNTQGWGRRRLGGVVVQFLPPTSEAPGSNLRPGVGSYLPMSGGFLHLKTTRRNMTLAVERDVKTTNKQSNTVNTQCLS